MGPSDPRNWLLREPDPGPGVGHSEPEDLEITNVMLGIKSAAPAAVMLRLRSFALALVAASACTASNPADVPGSPGPDAGSDRPEPVELRVEPPPVTTPWKAYPITGVGPAKGTLIYRVGALEDTVRLGATGEFCVDVPLAMGDNAIEIEAVSASGEFGDPERLSIRREGEPPAPEPLPDDLVVADRTPGTAFFASKDTGWGLDEKVYLDQGSFAELVDGNTSQAVEFHGLDVDNGEVIAFALKERMAVHGFKVTAPPTGGDTCGPEGFQIWLSDELAPELELDGVSWLKLAEVTAEDHVAKGTTYELDAYVAGFNARYLAIKMTDSSCVDYFSLTLPIYYAINEIRVIAEKDGSGSGVPRDGAPSCAAGGF